MRIFINFMKLVGYLGLGCLILVITAAVALVHYQGLVSGIELLNLENAPLGIDPLIGWFFEAITPDATFANWMAISITALTLLMSFFTCHYLIGAVQLLLNAGEYLRNGQARDFWRALATNVAFLCIAIIPLMLIIRGDAWLFQFRVLAGAMSIDDPVLAAGSVPSPAAIPPEWLSRGPIDFLDGVGYWMYIGIAIAAPFTLEIIANWLGQISAILEAEVEKLFLQTQEVESSIRLYGYDSRGNPVYDSTTPITYDADQNPVGTGVSPQEYSATAEEPDVHTSAIQEENEPVDRQAEVIGGAEQETVKLSEAIADEARYHVVHETRTVYARKLWDSLNTNPQAVESDVDKEAA